MIASSQNCFQILSFCLESMGFKEPNEILDLNVIMTSTDISENFIDIACLNWSESHSRFASSAHESLFSLKNSSSHGWNRSRHTSSIKRRATRIWVVLDVSQVVVSSWQENVKELVIVEGTILGGVELCNDFLTVIKSDIIDQIVLHEFEHLFSSDFSVFSGIENFKKGSLILCELSHMWEYLS